MNRLGFRPEAFAAALARLRALTVPALELRVDDASRARRRARRGDDARAGRAFRTTLTSPVSTGAQHLATSIGNSAGTLGWPRRTATGCGPGSRCTASRRSRTRPRTNTGSPVMTLETHGAHGARREARRDRWVTRRLARASATARSPSLPRDTATACRGIWPTARPCSIGGARYPLVGRVSMDMIAVDVTGAPQGRGRQSRGGLGRRVCRWRRSRPCGHDSVRTAVRRQPASAARAEMTRGRRSRRTERADAAMRLAPFASTGSDRRRLPKPRRTPSSRRRAGSRRCR